MNSPSDHLTAKRHTLAHLLAAAVLELYPDTKPTIGPAIDNGFYYDFEFSKPITNDDLKQIEKKMRSILPSWKEMTGKEVSESEAKEIFKNNPYKLELINEIVSRNEKLTVYTAHDSDDSKFQIPNSKFLDLCRGGHAENPAKEIEADSFQLTHIAGAYWRGSEKNKMLTRIYGLAFETKADLDAYENMLKEAEKRDHKKLGKELDLFLIDEEVGKGLPMWTPKGTIIKFALEKFTRDLEMKYGYDHVSTPYLGSEKLYQKSGHLDHYRKNMYAPIDMDGDIFYLRPMACPHHIRMLQRKPISYRDLPVRYAEIADYNRYEKSGELMGMIRLRKFQLTDAHIFTSPEGLKDEFINVCRLIQEGMKGLGLDGVVTYRFSRRDPENKEKYFPDDALWDKAETIMKNALDEIGIPYTEALDEAAFYGPKLDIQSKNVNGKEDTLFTAQIDFLLPEKFDINYTAQDGTKKRVVMIHRSTIGALERVFAFLIEHYGGNFPLWLSPVQVEVIPVAEAHFEAAQYVHKLLNEAGIRSEIDLSNDGFGKKIRNAKTSKIPYFIIIGQKDIEANKVTLESRDKGQIGQLAVEEVLQRLSEEIKSRK